MKKLIALSIAALTLAFAVPQALSAADSAATIKKNMAERKPKIEVLKKAGSVGENKAGYLEAMTKETAGKEVKLSDDEKKLVEDENKDRKAVSTPSPSRKAPPSTRSANSAPSRSVPRPPKANSSRTKTASGSRPPSPPRPKRRTKRSKPFPSALCLIHRGAAPRFLSRPGDYPV